MNFVSKEFWVVLFLAVSSYLLFRNFFKEKGKWDRQFLLGLSFLLFASESLVSFAIFIAIGCWIYLLLQWQSRWSDQLAGVFQGIGIAVALAPLIFFKYWRVEESIPVGLSFYTFQLLSLYFDARREKLSAPSLRDYWSFASFFPQIVAGPIERRTSLLPQLQEFRFRWDSGSIQKGLSFIILGFFYKLVVADNLASSCNWVTQETTNAWAIHVGNFLFGFRIYFDFCGYSLIAYGLAAALGIRLTMNFQAPYWQTNPQNFWRTWHVSLSRWFRDYIYFPLGGKDSRRPALLILLVFGVSGVWHGAGWNFVLWGVAHGFLLIAYRKFGSRIKMPKALAWSLTLLAMMTCWLAFYQTDSALLLAKLSTLVSPQNYLSNPYRELLGLSGGQGNLAYVVAAAMVAAGVLLLEGFGKWKKENPYHWGQNRWIQALLIIATVMFAPVENNGFVYFDF